MSKYQPLTDYLSQLEGDAFTTNIAAIEDILGFELPSSSRQYPAWWANQERGQSLAWQSVGWKTADVSLGIGMITFVRSNSETEDRWQQVTKQLSIAQAKAGLARTFGVSPDCIEITIRV
jgi:hypothetical protein